MVISAATARPRSVGNHRAGGDVRGVVSAEAWRSFSGLAFGTRKSDDSRGVVSHLRGVVSVIG